MHVKRPASLTFLGITNIVFGGLAVLGSVFALFLMFGGSESLIPEGGVDVQAMLTERHGWYDTYAKISAVLGLPVAIVLLASGIGLLKLYSWGRSLANAYAVFAIITAIVSLTINIMIVMPLMTELAQVDDPVVAGAGAGGLGGALAGSCMAIGYPVILLIFVNRKGVKDAIAAANQRQSGEVA